MLGIGCDHAAYGLKEILLEHLRGKGREVKDFGVFDAAEVADYPAVAREVAVSVARGECEGGILICGTGLGMSMAANKISGIRAALCTDGYMARMSREHNNANVLALGAWVVGKGLACEIADIWLAAEFQGGKHEKRLRMISNLEGRP